MDIVLLLFLGIIIYTNRKENKDIINNIIIYSCMALVMCQLLSHIYLVDTINYNTELALENCIDYEVDNMTFGSGRADQFIREEVLDKVDKYIYSKEESRDYYMYDTVDINVNENKNFLTSRLIFALPTTKPDIQVKINDNTGILDLKSVELKERIESKERYINIGGYEIKEGDGEELSLYRNGDKLDIILAYNKSKLEEDGDNIIREYHVIKVKYSNLSV